MIPLHRAVRRLFPVAAGRVDIAGRSRRARRLHVRAIRVRASDAGETAAWIEYRSVRVVGRTCDLRPYS